MKRFILLFSLMFFISLSFAQNENEALNTSMKLLQNTDQKLSIGGYGQIDYNQKLDADLRQNGKLDVHRLVMLFAYNFDEKTSFVTEIEYEHVKEVYIEQAFLQYRFNTMLNFRAGLLLIPMGIINEYHEPTSFNGVERPNLDKYLIPTTWREIGLGFTGRINSFALKYQLYLVNGFKSYKDGVGTLSGKSGFRGGRQKGAESFISSPNFTARIDHFAIPGMKLGLSAYYGNTQSDLYNGLDKNDPLAKQQADSSVVNLFMTSADLRYNLSGFELRAQASLSNIKNSKQYNQFTNSDLGDVMLGYYVELGYNVLNSLTNVNHQITPFIRYEYYNTHYNVNENLTISKDYNITEIITGLGWKMNSGAVLKADMQFTKAESDNKFSKQFNMGVGIWF